MANDADTVADPSIGIMLDGRYRLERMLGSGAVGRVYQASHVALGRPVAIKVLDPRLVSDDEARRRFEREAQAAGRLRHPNCVGVTDFGSVPDGSRYLVMELVDGVSLDQVLVAQTRLPLERALRIMRQVLSGLAHAHGQGLVHRDLKPENLMLESSGDDREEAKILDFGLARIVGSETDRITRTGIICGTPTYMAPEQVQDLGFDGRTDLYAASVMLFEMLAGRPPFEAKDSPGILKMHLLAPVPRIAEVAPGVVVPAAVEEVIRRGLAKRPDERPATAEQYLAELDRASAPRDATIELSEIDSLIVPEPTPPPVPRRARRFSRRQLAIAGTVAGVLLIGIIAAIAGGDSSSPQARPETVAMTGAVVAEPAIEIDEPEPARSMDPEIATALGLAGAGRAKEAMSKLRELRRQRPDDPQVPYALGRVYKRLGWPKQTIEAYRDAMKMDPSLREDPQLIRDLVGLLGSRSSWQLAADVLEHDVGAAAVPALSETAEHHREATVRSRAARIRDRL